MHIKVKAVVAWGLLTAALPALANGDASIRSYSQKALLKNWALSACLAIVAKDAAERDDANAAAAAYMEFGHQDIETYGALRKLAEDYAGRVYAGSVPGKFNTMKCIDLYNSTELERLTAKLAKQRK